jgi:hypothetical protein
VPFPDFPPAQPSGYYQIGASKTDAESGVTLWMNGTPSVSLENSEKVQEMLDELHGALSPLGWTVSAYEITDMQRSYEFTEPEPAEPTEG